MKSIIQRGLRRFGAIVFGCVLLWLTPAEAYLRVEVSADENGLSLHYVALLAGVGSVRLTDPGDSAVIPLRIMFSKVGEIELALVSIAAGNATMVLHAAIATIADPAGQPALFEADFPLPFGTYGVEINPLGRSMPSLGAYALEAGAVLLSSRTSYDIRADLPPLIIDQQWAGTATPEDNLIHEEVRSSLDGSLLLEADLALEYQTAFMTTVSATLQRSASPPDIDPELYTVTIPNGS